ncbi:MAG: hypothetical protein F9K23_12170 [Bacteroidetes bacterium]|nr:MAG: hypothetical protein F9K23_12170 [Bacteroidota bacterium]
MKTNLIFALILFLLATSSCSSRRFGNIPKVKAQPKKEQTAKRKPSKKQTVLIVKPTILLVATDSGISKPNIAKPQQQVIKKQKKLLYTTTKAVSAISKNKVKVFNTAKENRIKKSSNNFDDFWDTWLGELVLYIAAFIIIGAIYIFIEWLISIGLAWVVAILALALIIYLLYLIGEFIDGVLDFLFRR